MQVLPRHLRVSILLAVVLSASTIGCLLSKGVTITSEPTGAEIWVANQPAGLTPADVRVGATGVLDRSTFDPVLVTLEAEGYKRAVREIHYSWSGRNVLASLPLLGIPLIFVGRLPEDTHVIMVPEQD